jgi:hypothetical protein
MVVDSAGRLGNRYRGDDFKAALPDLRCEGRLAKVSNPRTHFPVVEGVRAGNLRELRF